MTSAGTRQRIDIENLANGGDGVGRLADGRVVFVTGALPGEEVEAEIVEVQSSFARAITRRVLRASDDRCAPGCQYADRCGGCQLWHLAPEAEIGLKASAARDTVARIGHFDELPALDTVAAPRPRNYRTRVTYRYEGTSGRLGFYAQNSHDLVAIRRCPVAHPKLDEARRHLERLLGPHDAELRLETAGGGEVVATLDYHHPEHVTARFLDGMAATLLPIVEGQDTLRGVAVRAGTQRRLVGDDTVAASQVLADGRDDDPRLPAGLFRQANAEVNRLLVDHVRACLVEREASHLLELYCGSGNFSFALADELARLVGVEGDEAAIEAARTVADARGLTAASFHLGDLDRRDIAHLDDDIDAVLLDPPRTGAKRASRQLARRETTASTIVYVSCDAACLARDLRTLADGGWQLEGLTFFDMFPRTAHVEAVAVLER
jgi:23S rRNA (uracil1939-C5)-methyltransferase